MVSIMTSADRVVILDSALSIDTTGARTWVLTLGVDTGQPGRTIIAEETLWSTLLQWISLIVSDTLTHSLAS